MLIGSRALAYWNPDFGCKEDADWDFIGEVTVDVPPNAKVEVHNLEEQHDKNMVDFYMSSEGVCIPTGLYVVKRSHLWRDYQWDKHIAMFHGWIKPAVHTLLALDKELLLERTMLTKEKYPQRNPNLDKTNDDFFDDAVEKVYDHDYLHELYAYEDRPMFERLKKDDKRDKAWCEKDLWLELSHEQRIQCVCEETYVIATERFLVPNQWNFAYRRAYYRALKKVCTTLTSGWFRDFAIDNFPEIFDNFDATKIDAVKEKLNDS